jgi:aspartate carbamoyltransferase catalytic subunit
MRDFSKRDITSIIDEALKIKRGELTVDGMMERRVLASLFFEDSTRTRESTEMAAYELIGWPIGFASAEGTSVRKGEPLKDTVRMYQGLGSDILVMRHPLEGAARFVADVIGEESAKSPRVPECVYPLKNMPIINGGDGSNSHPTQTLLDLMTIT